MKILWLGCQQLCCCYFVVYCVFQGGRVIVCYVIVGQCQFGGYVGIVGLLQVGCVGEGGVFFGDDVVLVGCGEGCFVEVVGQLVCDVCCQCCVVFGDGLVGSVDDDGQ